MDSRGQVDPTVSEKTLLTKAGDLGLSYSHKLDFSERAQTRLGSASSSKLLIRYSSGNIKQGLESKTYVRRVLE